MTLRIRGKRFIVRPQSIKRRTFGKPRVAPVKKKMFTCYGGPWDGERIPLSSDSPNTYPFRVGKWHGHYADKGTKEGEVVWLPAAKPTERIRRKRSPR